MPLGKDSQEKALVVANSLRMMGFKVDICYDDVKLSNMFKRAEKKNAKVAIIIGENEIYNGEVVVKNLASKEQITVKLNELEDKVAEIVDSIHKNEYCEGEECERKE